MKNKQSNLLRRTPSNKNKTRQAERKDIRSSLNDEQLMHQMIETLSDKIEEFHQMMNDTQSQMSEISPNPSTTEINESETRIQNPTSTSADLIDNTLASEIANNTNIETDPDRALLNVLPIQNNAASNSVSSASTLTHRTSYDYASDQTTNYQYGFTNSEFFAFIGNLDPVEYIIIITIITILISVQLNVFEKQVVSGALVDIGVSLGNMVEQELFQRARQNEFSSQQRHQAEQTDFDTLYEDIDKLQAEINALKQQLGLQ